MTERAVGKFMQGANFADVLPYNENEASSIAAINIGHLAAGNTKAFLIGTAAISKIDRSQAIEKRIYDKVMANVVAQK